MSHRRGASAEQQVQDSYARRGYSVAATRWRGRGGEIDLILRRGGTSIFVEVKAARDADTALSRIRPAQIARIHAAASEYLGTLPDGSLSETRFDAACVDGYGRVTIHENILAHP
ncbi:YraN family protein [Wenxinia saemankumensis]|nr:YraN family protein [Wenxinia saemankumensis]